MTFIQSFSQLNEHILILYQELMTLFVRECHGPTGGKSDTNMLEVHPRFLGATCANQNGTKAFYSNSKIQSHRFFITSILLFLLYFLFLLFPCPAPGGHGVSCWTIGQLYPDQPKDPQAPRGGIKPISSCQSLGHIMDS